MERPAELDVNVDAEPLGEPTFGLWCDLCLSSTVTSQLFVVGVDGVLHELYLATVCEQCGQR